MFTFLVMWLRLADQHTTALFSWQVESESFPHLASFGWMGLFFLFALEETLLPGHTEGTDSIWNNGSPGTEENLALIRFTGTEIIVIWKLSCAVIGDEDLGICLRERRFF